MATAANAANSQTVGETEETLFLAGSGGGSQIRGALAFSVYNGNSTETLLIRTNWHGSTEFMPVPPTSSITFEVEDEELEIRGVYAKRGGSTDVTGVGWGVTKKGKGSVAP